MSVLELVPKWRSITYRDMDKFKMFLIGEFRGWIVYMGSDCLPIDIIAVMHSSSLKQIMH